MLRRVASIPVLRSTVGTTLSTPPPALLRESSGSSAPPRPPPLQHRQGSCDDGTTTSSEDSVAVVFCTTTTMEYRRGGGDSDGLWCWIRFLRRPVGGGACSRSFFLFFFGTYVGANSIIEKNEERGSRPYVRKRANHASKRRNDDNDQGGE